MTDPAPVTVVLRIPGRWSHPSELAARLPARYQVTDRGLVLPDGAAVGFGGLAPDDQFAGVFRAALRQPATADELDRVDGYTVNVVLRGPGGSLDAARAMMGAGAAVVRAGGAGVFIDNSALAHGGENWAALADDGGPDALSFAFTAVVRGRAEVWTMGLHVLGRPDVVMKRADVERGFDVVDVIRHLAASARPVGDGHVTADPDGPAFRATAEPDRTAPAGSPLHNPFGRLRLVSLRDIAEAN